MPRFGLSGAGLAAWTATQRRSLHAQSSKLRLRGAAGSPLAWRSGGIVRARRPACRTLVQRPFELAGTGDATAVTARWKFCCNVGVLASPIQAQLASQPVAARCGSARSGAVGRHRPIAGGVVQGTAKLGIHAEFATPLVRFVACGAPIALSRGFHRSRAGLPSLAGSIPIARRHSLGRHATGHVQPEDVRQEAIQQKSR